MNTFTTNTNAALQVAQYQINDRVRQAEQRAEVREFRAERRAAKRWARETRRLSAKPQNQFQLPWWAFRYLPLSH
jgi:hypothetical protein